MYLKRFSEPPLEIDHTWSLFLDRDGTINKLLRGDYVKNTREFQFLPGALEALSILNDVFLRVFIVTNQQGIGKGLMSENDLETVHGFMMQEIEKNNGRIDKIYYCPDLADSGSHNRKPMPGMGLQAKKDFPEISLQKSIMIGDAETDMEFGKNLNMITVQVGVTNTGASEKTDIICKDLLSFARELV